MGKNMEKRNSKPFGYSIMTQLTWFHSQPILECVHLWTMWTVVQKNCALNPKVIILIWDFRKVNNTMQKPQQH